MNKIEKQTVTAGTSRVETETRNNARNTIRLWETSIRMDGGNGFGYLGNIHPYGRRQWFWVSYNKGK